MCRSVDFHKMPNVVKIIAMGLPSARMFAPRFDPSALSQDDMVHDGGTSGTFDGTVPESPSVRKRKMSISESDSDDEHGEEDKIDEDEISDDSEEEQSDSDSDQEMEDEDNDTEDTGNEDPDLEDKGIKDIDKDNDPNYENKHSTIFSKFRSVMETQNDEEEDSTEEVEKHGFGPLPQPQLPRDKKLTSVSAYTNNLNWLADPIYSSPSITKPFTDFRLSEVVLHNLKSMGVEKAFSVQVATLDILLDDISKNSFRPDVMGDVLVNASTGSGKTLAYSIPIVEALYQRVVPRVRAIVLVPTKPLINQVKAAFVGLCRGTNLSVMSLRSDIAIKEEAEKLVANVPDIIVSTPGRLVDHLNSESLSLRDLRYLVIDEADRLLNQSFQNWCQILLTHLERPADISQTWKLGVQKLVFSATLTTDAGKLALLDFQQPRLIVVNDEKSLVKEMFTLPPTLDEYTLSFGTAKTPHKPLILAKFLIANEKLQNVLVFTKSNDSSMRLSSLLEKLFAGLLPHKVTVSYLNSTNNRTSIRSKIIKEFAHQQVHILVATDLIARGIDVHSVTDIINYDLPNSSRDYVHRVGRTARANRQGSAYNMVFGKGEAKWFKTLMGDIGRANKTITEVPIEFSTLVSEEDKQLYERSLESLQKEAHQ